jgi:ubiquinone/menaquinone biosynthesis C-methylase UbiE
MEPIGTAAEGRYSPPRYRHGFTRLTDSLIPVYNRVFEILAGPAHDLFRDHVSALACPGRHESLLDAGCGTGLSLLRIGVQFPGCVLYGLDISPGMIRAARRAAAGAGASIDLRVGSITCLPYSERSFDVVVTTLMFHHLDLQEKRRAVAEIARVLKRGGRYVSAEFGPRARNALQRHLAKGDYTLYPAHLSEAGLGLSHEELSPFAWGKKVFYRVAVKPEEY